MTDYKKRDLSRVLQDALADMPVVVLTGMRQVGKSTLLEKDPAFRGRRYITLDDFAQLEAAKKNPENLLSGEVPLTIDEAQRCPELMIAIKRKVDQKRIPGRYLLCGSANFALLKGITETLAGRAVYLTLHPFSLREADGPVGSMPFLPKFFHSPYLPQDSVRPLMPVDILWGGMPSVRLGHLRNPGIWFKGYEQTYMDRDLRQLAQVGDLLAFRNLLQFTALRSGKILNISGLGRDVKLNTPTTTRYLNLMETAFLIHRVGPFLGNRASRLIKSPKLYMADAGLACHLVGLEHLDVFKNEPLRGAMLETFVAQNLLSILEAHMPQAKIFFWNEQGRHEVDFVIESGRDVMAIEVKSASRWSQSDLLGLRAFLNHTPQCRTAILGYNGTHSVQLDKCLWALPLRKLLS